VAVTLTDQVLPRDAMARLRQRFPWAVTLEHQPPLAPGADGRTYRERVAAARTDLDLVCDFLAHVTGAPPARDVQKLCTSVIDEAAAVAG
jgi:exonuclease SbcD